MRERFKSTSSEVQQLLSLCLVHILHNLPEPSLELFQTFLTAPDAVDEGDDAAELLEGDVPTASREEQRQIFSC